MVNADPVIQQVLLLSVVTSKVEEVKRRRADCLATVVGLFPKDFDVLGRLSFVDCNSLKTIPLAEFNERFVRKGIRCFDKDLPFVLRRALRRAIHTSNIVAGELKGFVAHP